MFIQTEQTPNPDTIKFIPGRAVMAKGTAHFADVDAAKHSPLALRLFALDGVEAVFLGSDFVAVTKTKDTMWELLKTPVMAALMEHFTAGFPVMDDAADNNTESALPDDDLTRQICALLDERVRPAVAQDGGDIQFDRFEKGVLYLRMQGACSGCPSSTATLKDGIERMMRHYVPEVLEVRAA